MNNEPVAFWNKDFDLWEENAIQTCKADGWDIPLYTHPADLTDEEIKELATIMNTTPAKIYQLRAHINREPVSLDKYDESKHNQAQLMLRMLNAENEALKDKLNLANKQIEILGDWIK